MPFVALGTTIEAPSGATQGSVLYRGALRWEALGPGTSGYVLQTQGVGAAPVWAAGGGGGSIPSGSGIAEVSSGAWVSTARSLATVLGDILTTRGDLFTRGGSGVTRLAVGGAGAFLRTNGTDPSWSTLTLPNAAATGSLLYASGADTGAALAVGTTGQFLWVTGGLPAWRTIVLSDVGAPTADFAMGAHKLTGLAAGTAAGDSARWEQTPAGIFTTRGDNVVAGASAVPQRLALGAAGTFRRSDGTDDKWSTSTLADSYARGDIVRASAANVLGALSAKIAGTFLGGDGTDVTTRTALQVLLSELGASGIGLATSSSNYWSLSGTCTTGIPGKNTSGCLLFYARATGASPLYPNQHILGRGNATNGIAIGTSSGQLYLSAYNSSVETHQYIGGVTITAGVHCIAWSVSNATPGAIRYSYDGGAAASASTLTFPTLTSSSANTIGTLPSTSIPSSECPWILDYKLFEGSVLSDADLVSLSTSPGTTIPAIGTAFTWQMLAQWFSAGTKRILPSTGDYWVPTGSPTIAAW